MNLSLIGLELAVVLLAIGILLADLWTPPDRKRLLGYAAAGGLFLILLASFFVSGVPARYAFGETYVLDEMGLFFKRFFLLTGILVIFLSMDFADRIQVGISEFYAIVLFALSGMLFAASAHDFILMFVSLELITISFYVLNSFQRSRLASLEAGVKYLILGAVATAFTVYGIALIFGAANTTQFDEIRAAAPALRSRPIFLLGLLMVMVGLGFKIGAFPLQIWVPDVYQGSPTPATAFLAAGSKAAGFALLLRVFFTAVPQLTSNLAHVVMVIAAITILYGNLCAIPQRNLKRLLGYSSIAHAGYLLLGVAAMNAAGSSALLYYLAGYLFTVLAAFTVISVATRGLDGEDVSAVAGLHQRSPLLAFALSLAMISLAGIPPLAGFFGKFLLLKAVIEGGPSAPATYWVLGVAVVGIVISFYYYLGVVRTIYWGAAPASNVPIPVSGPIRYCLFACIAGMLYLGLFPNALVNFTERSAKALEFHRMVMSEDGLAGR